MAPKNAQNNLRYQFEVSLSRKEEEKHSATFQSKDLLKWKEDLNRTLDRVFLLCLVSVIMDYWLAI